MPRLLPAAITPVGIDDLARALGRRRRHEGLEELRAAMAAYHQAAGAYSFTSLMRTVYVCLRALARNDRRKKVVLARYSCPSFAHAILAAGLSIHYCDVCPTTLSIDLDQLGRIEADDTLAVICANLFGLAYPMDEVVRLCRDKQVALVEGADYSIGTEYRSRRVGTFGDFTILNFQEGKALPIGGGMVLSRKADGLEGLDDRRRGRASAHAELMLAFALVSRPRSYFFFNWAMRTLGVNTKGFSMEDTIRDTTSEFDYRFDATQPLLAISDLRAALGLELLSRLDDHRAIRERNGRELRERLAECRSVTQIVPEPGVNRVHYIRYPVLVARERRAALRERLFREGFEASTMYVEHGMKVDPEAFPGAAQVAAELLTLPCHPLVQSSDVARMVSVIASTLARVGR